MTFVVFVAPKLSPSASQMVEAIATLPDVSVGVVTLDAAEHAPAAIRGRLAAHWRVDDVLDTGQLLWAVRSLAGRHGMPSRLFGAYEQLQVPLAEARTELGIPGMSVETALDFRDKSRMKDVLGRAGLPCARHRLASSAGEARRFAEEVGLPLVVKPPAGAGAQATHRVESLDELAAAVDRAAPSAERPVLLEEFMTGREHSLESMSVGGEVVWQSLTRYDPTPLEVVETPWIQWTVVLPRETMAPEFADIRDTGARALRALGMDSGLTHMEWFRRPDGSVAISEVAARPPGAQITTLVSRANDVDFVRAWARVMVFGDWEPLEQRYSAGCAYLRGQGPAGARVRAVYGLDTVWRELGDLITDARIPAPGQLASTSYEGEGHVIVRHPETRVVEDAVRRIVSVARVELG